MQKNYCVGRQVNDFFSPKSAFEVTEKILMKINNIPPLKFVSKGFLTGQFAMAN